MLIGVAYYPEHWPQERWPVDAQLMQEAGLNLVRMAEFAWGKLEPEEGRFDFDWLDEAIAILAARGIRTMLGTPTEAMPPWVARRYPECVAMERNGQRLAYGGRRDNCPTSTTYRRLSQGITQAMARHYGRNPHIVGWQIDNEFSGPYCYCEACLDAWHQYLAATFGSIAELNRRWGTIFWSHTYATFAEVPLPRRADGNNPSLELEFHRFHSRQVVSFQQEQVDILRRRTRDQCITHNLCGFFVGDIDYYDLAQGLDFAGHDYYYNNSVWSNRLNVARYESAAMDLMRSVKKRNFMVTETPAGTIGSQYMLRNLRPLELRRMNFQAVGHGADGLLWFRWRACRFGLEQFTHGVLGHDGVPGRRYRDVARVAGELQQLAPALDGSTVRADAAILYTYENRWALQFQPNARDLDYCDHLFQYHRALKREGLNVDFVNRSEALDGYRLLIIPAGYIMRAEFAARVEAFVRAGGILLLTFRSAVKDEDNVATDQTLPGLLRAMAGLRIEEYEALLEPTAVRFGKGLGGGVVQASRFAEWCVPEAAQVLARFAVPHLREFAAVTVNRVGQGAVYYVATSFVEDASVRRLVRHALDAAEIARPVVIPEGVDTSVREKGEDRFLFLMNHNDEAVRLDLRGLPPCRELLTSRRAGKALALPGGEVAVLHWQARQA